MTAAQLSPRFDTPRIRNVSFVEKNKLQNCHREILQYFSCILKTRVLYLYRLKSEETDNGAARRDLRLRNRAAQK